MYYRLVKAEGWYGPEELMQYEIDKELEEHGQR